MKLTQEGKVELEFPEYQELNNKVQELQFTKQQVVQLQQQLQQMQQMQLQMQQQMQKSSNNPIGEMIQQIVPYRVLGGLL